jgi:hypothetical protein
MYVPHSTGLIIATSPKCASTSINNCYHVEGTKPLSLAAVIELKKSFWKVVGIVRDPIDRFESAYNFFQYGQCGNFPTGKYSNIREFTNAVLSGVEDDHWAPQSKVLKKCDRYADLETLPLDRKQNTVKHIEKATYKIDELKILYADDYNLRGNTWAL